jgi:hypothetical protein
VAAQTAAGMTMTELVYHYSPEGEEMDAEMRASDPQFKRLLALVKALPIDKDAGLAVINAAIDFSHACVVAAFGGNINEDNRCRMGN